MKRIVCLLLFLMPGQDLLMAQSPSRSEILKSYAELLSYRTQADTVLQGGQGVMVIKADEGSVLQALDIVVSINKVAVQSVNQLLELTHAANPNQAIELALIRTGKAHTLTVPKNALQALYSDMLPAQVDKLISAGAITDKKLTKSQDAMIHEYLKGRPYRTPNNRDDLPSREK